jgi:ectoine hydroxylase-related dioxygenase (phytanoyl-CoA dioxygenase family)
MTSISHTKKSLEDDLKPRFEEQGYVILHGILEPEVIRGVRKELKHLVDECGREMYERGEINDLHQDKAFETRLYHLYQNHVEDAPRRFREELHRVGMYPLFFHPRLLDVVESILGTEIRLYPNYTVRPKFPNWAGHQVLWHQDGGYTEFGRDSDQDVSALRMVNVWTPLVPVSVENGCMQFVPGTHKLGAVPHESKEHYLEIAQEHLKPRLEEAVNIILDPGDVVLFHNMLFHQGLPNRSQEIRWSVDWRYQDATQPTLRPAIGHIARSRNHPETVVHNAREWAHLSFV